MLRTRDAIAAKFRAEHGCSAVKDGFEQANVFPYFIGVFDTVASLGSKRLTLAVIAGAFAVLAALSWVQSFFLFPFVPVFFWLFLVTSFVIEIWYAVTHLRYATGLQKFSFWQTLPLHQSAA